MDQSTDPGGVLGPYAAALRAALLQPFLRLNFVTLWVRDQERSRRFFMERLMFEAVVGRPAPEGRRRVAGAPTASGSVPGTTRAGLPRIALLFPPPRAPQRQHLCQNTALRFLTDSV